MKLNPRKQLEAISSSSENETHQKEGLMLRDSTIDPRPFIDYHLEGIIDLSEQRAKEYGVDLQKWNGSNFPYLQDLRMALGEDHTFYAIACETKIVDDKYLFIFIEKTDISNLSGTLSIYVNVLKKELG